MTLTRSSMDRRPSMRRGSRIRVRGEVTVVGMDFIRLDVSCTKEIRSRTERTQKRDEPKRDETK